MPADCPQAQCDQAVTRYRCAQVSVLVGLIYIALGTLRLGFLTNFLSHSVISGFTTGAAIVIGVSQVCFITQGLAPAPCHRMPAGLRPQPASTACRLAVCPSKLPGSLTSRRGQVRTLQQSRCCRAQVQGYRGVMCVLCASMPSPQAGQAAAGLPCAAPQQLPADGAVPGGAYSGDGAAGAGYGARVAGGAADHEAPGQKPQVAGIRQDTAAFCSCTMVERTRG